MAWKRSIVVDIAGGTATATIQMPVSGKIARAYFCVQQAAAGSWELSKSSTSQIATTAPDVSVLARVKIAVPAAAVANSVPHFFELNVPVKILDNIYLHCTGAGNAGTLTLVME
jgi:hypothetical protein